MKKQHLLWFVLIIVTMACNAPFMSSPEMQSDVPAQPEFEAEAQPDTAPDAPPAAPAAPLGPPPSGDVLMPEDFEYLGAFRLPGDSGGSNWEYSGRGLTYYPDGDSSGTEDGFPGSLFGVGHDHQQFVSEISIPAPVNSRNLEDLPVAETLQPFEDITSGMFGETELPRLGVEYLPPQGQQTSGKLHFVHGQHFQDFELSHGWSELDLGNPQPAGPWLFGGYTNYVTSDYVFEIPGEWSAALPDGPRLATGRFREGVWGGLGPTLFAYNPWVEEGNPPAAGATLQTITPLLLFGTQEPGMTDITSDESTKMNGYLEPDHWWDGAWLTSGD
ncbi:MAG: hypothetical protein K8R77_15340, partial [Anaerolineaceae bacterium]|nr:hypothetical protein [Anaerolineaceae bacterium]